MNAGPARYPMARYRNLIGVAVAIGLSGCYSGALPTGPYSQSEYERQFLAHFERAAYSISGDAISVRSSDTKPWQGVHITLDTDDGYFRRTTGDMEPGQVQELPLRGFVDDSGKAFGPGIKLKSVWIQARYPDGAAVNEMAFPAETFGYKSPVPPGG